MNRFDKLLLTELRVLQGHTQLKEGNIDLYSAILDNENIKALGYKLTFEGIVRLAKDYSVNPKLVPLYKRIQELEPSVEVSPMYPNFPRQVLDMDEVTFRTHQVLHYQTTYGIEHLLDIEVQKGWLPETAEFKERLSDKQIADLKTLDYLSDFEIDNKVIVNLIGRKERLEPKELEIAKIVAERTVFDIDEIPFKENIGAIFGDALLNGELEDRQKALSKISNVVKHPGDVLDIVEQLVVLNKYKHFKTSLKRGLVELIEKFPNLAIEENLASNRWSKAFLGKKGKSRARNRNIALIDYLSYNRFSKNDSARNLVSDLKSGLLYSWNQSLEQAYAEQNYDEVTRLLRQRPGVYFRQINRLVKLGVDYKVIAEELEVLASELKTQSIVSTLNNFTGDNKVDTVFFKVLIQNLKDKVVEEINGKKVYLESNEIDYSRSKLEISDKSTEGGYISNGMAIKIPETAKFLRFFTYWNDERRIDIDLHGTSIDGEGDITHVGWNGIFNDGSIVHSGDITHSDATEYIDFDLEKAKKGNVKRVQFNINSFTGVPFNKIDTVFTGLMLLSKLGEKANLFDSKNVLFRHDLESRHMALDYGMIDLENNVIYVGGEGHDEHNDTNTFETPQYKLTIETYLNLLFSTQKAELVNTPEEADVILGLSKADNDNYVSLIDNNFFM